MRRTGSAIALIVLVSCGALAPSSAQAAGGVYNVVKCHVWHAEADELTSAGSSPSYTVVDDCRHGAPDPKVGLYNTGAAGNNAYKQVMWTAPAGTHIARACFDYKLRRDQHHRAEILTFPGFGVIASGGDGPDGWAYGCANMNAAQLIVRLACSEVGGCPSGPNAHAYVRNVTITLADEYDPLITNFGGDLLGGGWIRGSKTLVGAGSDFGSGVHDLYGYVNSNAVGSVDARCEVGGLGWNYSVKLLPCVSHIGDLVLTLDTRQQPFVDGSNTIALTAFDYGGNAVTRPATVLVDNRPPRAEFRGDANSGDPETIRAMVTDAHSGVRDVSISYRAVGAADWQPLATRVEEDVARAHVDSSAVPAGEYEFILRATDVAGNEAESTLRTDGTPMRLSFPLREPVQLRAGLGEGRSPGQTVGYGEESSVHGRLLDQSGEPIASQRVVVVDRFSNGALFPRAERPVTTNEQGRFAVPEPAGPTRSVEVEFHGTNSYLPKTESVGKFEVKGAASFRTSAEEVKEGTAIVFSGQVKHRGARIPAGGKLIEIQYRLKTGRQRTLKEPFRSNPDGSYRLAYRFSKALTADALFHFRVRVRGEGNWPFKGSASKWRKVVVRAR